jgi:hypothetical protein
MVGSDNPGPGVLEDIDLFNTIISNSRWWIDLLLANNRVKDFSSDHNVFWPNGTLERFLLNFNPMKLQPWRNQTGQDKASSTDNPRFKQNPKVNDYYTLAGSPPSSARDKAMPIPNMSVPACTGGPSVNPPDIGFRESC